MLRRYASLKNFNQKHPDADTDANTDTDTGLTTMALPVLHTGEVIIT